MSSKPSPPAKRSFRIRPLQFPQDYSAINDLTRGSSYDDGVHIFELNHKHSRCIARVAVSDDREEIVGCSIVHVISTPYGEIVFRSHTNVHPEWQGVGIASEFRKAFGHMPTAGNSSGEALQKLSHWLKGFGPKFVCYSGIPGKISLRSQPNEIRIRPATDSDHKELTEYDRTVFEINREDFMKAWCSVSTSPDEPFARTLLARDTSERIVGFGTLRLFNRTFEIQPLYADNWDIAERLLDELVLLYQQQQSKDRIPLHLVMLASNRPLTEYCKRIGLASVDAFVRSYTQGTKSNVRAQDIENLVHYDKVHAVLYYWPV